MNRVTKLMRFPMLQYPNELMTMPSFRWIPRAMMSGTAVIAVRTVSTASKQPMKKTIKTTPFGAR